MKTKNRVPSGTIGAALELRVAADLLLRGFEVFRALSPACSCDLVVQRDGTLRRVECRAGRFSPFGSRVDTDRHHYADILAIALPDGILYEPELPEQPNQPASVSIEAAFGKAVRTIANLKHCNRRQFNALLRIRGLYRGGLSRDKLAVLRLVAHQEFRLARGARRSALVA